MWDQKNALHLHRGRVRQLSAQLYVPLGVFRLGNSLVRSRVGRKERTYGKFQTRRDFRVMGKFG